MNTQTLTKNPKRKLLPDYHPETIDELTWSPYYCDDCETWHNQWSGLEIDNGEIFDVNCDTDGNWDREGTGERATAKNYERLNRERIAQLNRSQKEYLSYCAETGDDPLHEFYVDRAIKHKEHWQAQFTAWIGLAKHGFAVTGVTRGKTSYDPRYLPAHVSEFLQLKKVGDRFCMEGITNFDGMTGADSVKPNKVSFTVERETPRPGRIVKNEIKTAARQALERKQ